MPDATSAVTDRCYFTAPITAVEFAESGAGDGQITLRGHAAVYNRPSHDLGGFRTVIAPDAFDSVLDTNPDVHLLIDHDTKYVLARTTNKTLELRADPMGLHVWARLAPTSYAKDLEVLMRRGDVDQMSFACSIGKDEWLQNEAGDITRTVLNIDGLYDVTVCAQGAFPQTDATLLASMLEAGRVISRATNNPVAPLVVGGQEVAPLLGVGGQQYAALRARARAAKATHRQP